MNKIVVLLFSVVLFNFNCGGDGDDTIACLDCDVSAESTAKTDVEADAANVCGNGICEGSENNYCQEDCNENTKPECGDGLCEYGHPWYPENCIGCLADCSCPNGCGNGQCEGNEYDSCKKDCSEFLTSTDGDGICADGAPWCIEDCEYNPTDCACPDGLFCSLVNIKYDIHACTETPDPLAEYMWIQGTWKCITVDELLCQTVDTVDAIVDSWDTEEQAAIVSEITPCSISYAQKSGDKILFWGHSNGAGDIVCSNGIFDAATGTLEFDATEEENPSTHWKYKKL